MGPVIFSPVVLKALLIQRSQNLVRGTSSSIKGAHVVYQVLEHLCHVLFIADDQIDHSIANIYGETIPAKERREFDVVFGHADDVFSQHPEPTGEAAIDDILDIADIKAGATREMHKVLVTILLLSRILQFLLLHLINFLVFFLPSLFQVVFIGLQYVFGVVDALSVCNLYIFVVF